MVTQPIIGVVLAGGKSTRMGSVDKAELIFQEQTLIERAVKRLSSQVSEVLLSASQSYGLKNTAVTDHFTAQGPLGGVYSALCHVASTNPNARAILTVPVDAPFFPTNLATCLVPEALNGNCPATAITNDGWQPTFSCWPVSVLPKLKEHMENGEAGSLKSFLKQQRAVTISYDDPSMFFNINNIDDFKSLL